MTDIPVAAGPPCDFGDDHPPAIGSLMQFGDYSQTKFCGTCAPAFLREVADAIGGTLPDPSPAPDPQTAAGLTAAAPTGNAESDLDLSWLPAEDLAVLRNTAEWPADLDVVVMPSGAQLPMELFEQLRAAVAAQLPPAPAPVKPDPMTAKTVRSTHGNRKPRTPAAGTKPGPEGE